jgi:glutaredoxin-like protein NrdH
MAKVKEFKNMKKIKIYSLPHCGECQMVKDFFKKNNIEYEEVDVSEGDIQREFIERTKQMRVPVIEINDIYISGFNRDAILKNLENNEEKKD